MNYIAKTTTTIISLFLLTLKVAYSSNYPDYIEVPIMNNEAPSSRNAYEGDGSNIAAYCLFRQYEANNRSARIGNRCRQTINVLVCIKYNNSGRGQDSCYGKKFRKSNIKFGQSIRLGIGVPPSNVGAIRFKACIAPEYPHVVNEGSGRLTGTCVSN